MGARRARPGVDDPLRAEPSTFTEPPSVRSPKRIAPMLPRRLVPSLVLAVVVLLAAAAPASAGRKWCQKDPAFLVAGIYVSVDVAVYADQTPHVTGPIGVTLYVPLGTDATVAFTDDGFNGHGEAVAIVAD